MKKLIYCAAALATALFAGSCQQELLDTPAGETTVTYSVELPGEVTKAIGDGTNVDELVYELWIVGEDGEITRESTRLYQKTLVNKQENKWIVTLNLVQDQTYKVLFWAQVEKPEGHENYNTNNLTAVTYAANITKDYSTNQEDYAAFYASKVISTFTTPKRETVTLKRPFAQLNIGTDNDVTDYTVTMNTSKVTVAGVPTVFNVATSVATNLQTITFDTYSVPTEQLTVASRTAPYKYVAMNYVFASETGIVAKVSYDINSTLTAKNLDNTDGATTPATISNVIPNVPLQENYRTNIIGNLLSSKTQYDIVIDANFEPSTKEDMEVINAGLVENINGDYEISNVYGFAYAINNLFADGGTFYIHPGVYDFTGIEVEPQATKTGVILNVKANEVPVVTRSTPGFEIIGLDVAYLVSEVTNGSQALFSGLVLPEDTKLVGTNNGVVGVANCSNAEQETGEALIGNNDNGEVVNTVSMDSVEEIEAAMEQGLKLIELTGDMTLTDIFVVSSPVTIDGCGHTLTSTAGRAINVSGANGVTIKNLVIECTGERAINIIQNATNVTIDNVTATAANYTVNVAASAPDAVVNIENSTLNGLCTVNVASPGAEVTVDNSTINCNDTNTTEGEAYAAIGLNKDAVRGQIIVTNSTINVTEGSDSVKARNGAEDGSITIDGSEEEVTVQVAAITFESSDNYYSFTSLEGAIASAQKYNRPVTLIRNITVAEPVTVEESQTVVLDLNGKTLSNPNGYAIENYSELTITGEGCMSGLGGIRSHAGKVTIEDGTFTASSSWKNNTYQHILKAVNTEVTINGGVFTPTVSDGSNAMINVSENSTVTINGGEFRNVNEGEVIPQFAPYMFTYEKNGKLVINGGSFYGGWRFNGETATTDIYGGDFTVSYDGQSFHANSTHVLTIYGGTFSLENGGKLNPASHLAEGKIVVQDENGSLHVDSLCTIGDKGYDSLMSAIEGVKDGETIVLKYDVMFTETNRTHNSGTWYDGLYYIGDKSFTIDLGGKTITQDGAVNDYLLNFKNAGSKANTITLKNGTIDAGTTAFCAICTSSTQENELTINTENVNIINNMSNGSTIKLRGGAILNVNDGTIITGKNSYLGIECVASTVNIYDGAKIYMNGTSSYNGCLVGACGGGTVNVYGGYGKGVKGGFIAMTSGGTINVSGGEWIANTDGSIGDNSNLYVLTAQSNKYESGFVGGAYINVTGGTFRGGMDAWVLNNLEGEEAKITISGGNFNADPSSYIVSYYKSIKENGFYNVVKNTLLSGKSSGRLL